MRNGNITRLRSHLSACSYVSVLNAFETLFSGYAIWLLIILAKISALIQSNLASFFTDKRPM